MLGKKYGNNFQPFSARTSIGENFNPSKILINW